MQGPYNSHILVQSPYNSHILVQGPYNSHILVQGPYNSHILVQSPYNSHILVQGPYNSHILVQGPYNSHIFVQGPYNSHILLQGLGLLIKYKLSTLSTIFIIQVCREPLTDYLREQHLNSEAELLIYYHYKHPYIFCLTLRALYEVVILLM